MHYLLSAATALLLAATTRFIAGNLAAFITFIAVLPLSALTDRQPAILLALAPVLALAVRLAPSYSLRLLTITPIALLLLLKLLKQPLAPALALLLATVVTLLSLAARGWANKRLLD